MTDIKDLQKDGKALTRSPYMTIRGALEKQTAQLKDALPPNISVKRFLRVIYTQMHTNPTLLKCSKESLIAATFKSAERGLMPNGRHSALVPYWNTKKGCFEAQAQEMFQGLIYLARKSGDIADVVPATVCENDQFDYQLGLHMDMVHKPAMRNRGKPIAYYAIIVFPDGSKSFGPGPMTVEEIEAIRQRSKAKDSGPWLTDPEPMAWKTVIKRNLKYIGANPELEEYLIEDDNIEYGNMDVSVPMEPVEEPEQLEPPKPKRRKRKELEAETKPEEQPPAAPPPPQLQGDGKPGADVPF